MRDGLVTFRQQLLSQKAEDAAFQIETDKYQALLQNVIECKTQWRTMTVPTQPARLADVEVPSAALSADLLLQAAIPDIKVKIDLPRYDDNLEEGLAAPPALETNGLLGSLTSR